MSGKPRFDSFIFLILLLMYSSVVTAAGRNGLQVDRVDSLRIDTLGMRVMVPAYFDPPGSDWSRLEAQAAKMPGRLYAIANPNSGPGSRYDASYASAIATMHADSGRVIGYVWTNYGAVPAATVKSQIDQWYAFYPALDGIFFDGQSNVPGQEPYYLSLYNYVKAKDSASLVVGNPGTNTIESYLFYNGQRVTDVICIFETNVGFDTWPPPLWAHKYSRDNFYIIAYNTPAGQLVSRVQRAASSNVGWTYVTDATLPNPYDVLPAYFEDYCNYVVTGVPPPPPGGTGGVITIDGKFGDWKGLSPLSPAPNYPSTDPTAQITNVWATNDSANLYMSYQVAGSIDASKNFYHIFLDVDRDTANAKTGYVYNDSASIGAEFMVENSSFWKYNGSGGSNWSWVSAAGMKKADSAGRTELALPLNVLFPGQNQGTIQFLVEVNSAVSPYGMVNVAPGSYQTQCYVYRTALTTGITPVAPAAPSSYELSQNYPNPFNPTTAIHYVLERSGPVRLRVFDVLGREVATLVEGYQSAGTHVVTFDGTSCASGVYLYSLQAGGEVLVRKMVYLK